MSAESAVAAGRNRLAGAGGALAAGVWPTPGPRIAIVILNWNGGEDTVKCLESIQQVRSRDFGVIVVDNGSIDNSVALIRRRTWAFPLQLLETHSNLGYAGGNNVGIRLALENGAGFVLLLNNDTVVGPDLLEHLTAAADRYRSDGVFGPLMLYMDRPETVWFASGKWRDRDRVFEWPGQDEPASRVVGRRLDTDYVCGAAMLFRAETARRIGLLDERFFLVYEESDWCFRARRAGFGCRMVPEARVWHKVGASFGSEASPLRSYFSTRNELLWAEKNLGAGALIKIAIRAVMRHVPALSFGDERSVPFAKRFAWALAQYLRDWRRLMRDPRHRASRRGLRDYLLRRFGDCPAEVRVISAEWSAGPPGRTGPASAAPGAP